MSAETKSLRLNRKSKIINPDMGSLKKRRKAKINRHKRRKKLRLHRHKKRTWQK
jgi:hypothetical protein